MSFKKGHSPWNKGIKTGIKPWLGKKRPNLINTGAAKTMFKKGLIPHNKDDKTYGFASKPELRYNGIPWNKGLEYKNPKLARENHPAWKGGLPNCKDCGEQVKHHGSTWCIRCGPKGERSSFYKDGEGYERRTFKQNFFRSLDFQKLRIQIFQRDDFTCQICFEKGKYLNIDHIKSFLNYPDLRINPNNLRTLCVECHRNTPNYGYKAKFEKVVMPYASK